MKNNTIDDVRKLSLGSLYLIEFPMKIYGANTLIAMPVSIKQESMLLYSICVYDYNVLTYSDNSITIFPSGVCISRLLTVIAKISRIKGIVINKETVCKVIDLFADKMTYGEFGIRFKIKKREIDLTDTVVELHNDQVIALGLHPIKRMIDVSKWPRKAIMSWAKDHLKLGADSLKCMYDYNYFSDTNNKNLVDLLQKHHTYNAGKSRQFKQENGSYLREIVQKYMNVVSINTRVIAAQDDNDLSF